MRTIAVLLTPRRLAALLAIFSAAALTASLVASCSSSKPKAKPTGDPEPEATQLAQTTPAAGVVNTPPPGVQTVNVTLKEWSVTSDKATVPAGDVYFLASDTGANAHEFIVIKTDLAPDKLPTFASENGAVDQSLVNVVGKIDAFSPGTKASAVVHLDPGNYVLICNRLDPQQNNLSHFQQGMRTTFKVQ